MVTRIEREEVQRLLVHEQAELIEVLPREDYEELHLPGATNLPIKDLNAKAVQEMDRDRSVIVYCNDDL